MLALHTPGAAKEGTRELLPKVKANGWNGAIISISNPHDPNPNSKEFQSKLEAIRVDVRETIKATGYAAIRLSAWVPIDSPHWDKLKTKPRNTYGPYNPDRGMWDAHAGWLKALFTMLRAVCTELGVPVGRIFVEYANERGIGGVNGPLVGPWSEVKRFFTLFQLAWAAGKDEDAKGYWLQAFLPFTWQDGPMPEGWVPNETWEYLKYIRLKAGLGGLRGIGYTSEASTGDVGDTELESIQESTAAIQYLDTFEFPIAVNHYSKSAFNQWIPAEKRRRNITPLESAIEWDKRLGVKCDRVRAFLGPVMTRREKLDRIPVMEAGFWFEHAREETDKPVDPMRVAKFRRAYVDRMELIRDKHPMIGYYTGVSPDPTSNGTHLYQLKDSKLIPVGGEVGPNTNYDGSLETTL